jgi:uncharacterized membrane protein
MNQEEFPVYPPVKKTISMCKFKYNILEIKLFESVRVAVYLFDDKDMMVEARQYLIQGGEYNAWSSDDQYIVNLLKQKIQQPYL